jgi:hypothetical protein
MHAGTCHQRHLRIDRVGMDSVPSTVTDVPTTGNQASFKIKARIPKRSEDEEPSNLHDVRMVECCDSFKNKHAYRHADEVGQPIARCL